MFLKELQKTGDDKNYVWDRSCSKSIKNSQDYEEYDPLQESNVYFSLVPHFSRYCQSKNDHARLFYRISFINACKPGNFFLREIVSTPFFGVILTSLIEAQNVFLMINFDVWDRLGHV